MILNKLAIIGDLVACFAKLFLNKLRGLKIITYPKVVNFPITNKCNFRCVMCNVWRPEFASEPDMTSAEIGRIFSKSLFKHVRHVGISGGEPLLRKNDLLDCVINICESLPRLKSISFITNASQNNTLETLSSIKTELTKRQVGMNIEVSLDGMKEEHDLNRGCSGAFDKVLPNLSLLHSAGLLNSISTTITKFNCTTLWRTYQFARLNNIKIDFRIASIIGRLYNQELSVNFDFTQLEKLRIVKFLENIIFYYEKNNISKELFYKSLIGQLNGKQRQSGCDWKTSDGISLDPCGNLFFCFPKSKMIENINNDTSQDISLLKNNRQLLYETHDECAKCTHDYAGNPDIGFVIRHFWNKLFRPKLDYLYNSLVLLNPTSAQPHTQKQFHIKFVTIIGWYGTETLGDKAILGGIIINLFKDGIKAENVTIMSLHPSYTELTLIEMGFNKVKVIDAYSMKRDKSFYNTQDLFIFGGGPLCDIEPLVDMYEIFYNAKKAGKETYIYAAGIGPLKEKRYIKALNKLLSYANRISFRDELTIIKYKKTLPVLSDNNYGIFIDPATNYIRANLDLATEPILKCDYVLFAFRDWPFMYADGLDKSQYQEKNERYESQMLSLIKVAAKSGKKIVLFPMHTFCIGDDDREYYLKFITEADLENILTLVDHDYAPMEAINYFKFASYSVCLRFHSVVFSISCNVPCIAIDYHYGKGKISGFMQTVGLESLVYDMDSFITTDVGMMIDKVHHPQLNWASVNSVMADKNLQLYKYMGIK